MNKITDILKHRGSKWSYRVYANELILLLSQLDRQSESAILWIQKIQRFPKKRELLIIIQKIS